MKQCTFQGCENQQKYLTKGYCSTHYLRLRIHGDANFVTPRSQMGNHKHDMRHTVEYRTWCKMKERCNNLNNKDYANYGGRGIKIAEEWQHDFMAFYNYIGPRPEGFSIDRIDSNGNYEPGNVRWADTFTQSRNRNTMKNNKSGTPGIHWAKNIQKWVARKTIDGKRVVLGYYDNLDDAKLALG